VPSKAADAFQPARCSTVESSGAFSITLATVCVLPEISKPPLRATSPAPQSASMVIYALLGWDSWLTETTWIVEKPGDPLGP
jgi:hypothetical protein